MRRVLVLSTTTGYQLRSFSDAANELGVDLMFATDRCHTLDDPWRDGAVAVRFHEEDASLAALVRAVAERPIDGILAVGDRPVVLAARAARAAASESTSSPRAPRRWPGARGARRASPTGC